MPDSQRIIRRPQLSVSRVVNERHSSRKTNGAQREKSHVPPKQPQHCDARDDEPCRRRTERAGEKRQEAEGDHPEQTARDIEAVCAKRREFGQKRTYFLPDEVEEACSENIDRGKRREYIKPVEERGKTITAVITPKPLASLRRDDRFERAECEEQRGSAKQHYGEPPEQVSCL